jgi:predicted PurR-regulated permease PerM
MKDDPVPILSRPHRGPSTGNALEALAPWVIGAVAASGLYFARSVLVPITLAILLSFLLSPIVAGLRRARLPRSAAVLLAVAIALSGIATTSVVIGTQAATLSQDAPLYAQRITDKAARISREVEQRFGSLLQESRDGGSGHRKASKARRESARALSSRSTSNAIPVEVQAPALTPLEEVKAYLVPALAPLETALIVLIVTIFILFQKEDLRDRLIRLMGAADLHRTTLALDDGAKRLSRYFLSQFIVNCSFGAVIWGGLFLIGVPSPGLWGILAGLMRFIPYVGTVVALVGPFALAAAVDPGWGMIIWVLVLFVVVEPVVGYVIEPLLYGHSTGLSPMSVVIAALFWTWIWGPIGLVLSMPLTLILVVLGRYIPAFQVFDILLGDRPALTPPETFYQRVLAGHGGEAIEHAEDMLETMPLASYYDEVVLPGLRLAVADVDRGALQRAALGPVCASVLEVLAVLEGHRDIETAAPDLSSSGAGPPSHGDLHNQVPKRDQPVICFPGRGPLDAAISSMMAQLLRRKGWQVTEETRGAADRLDVPHFIQSGARAICVLGLFDERAFRRMQPLVQQISGAPVLIGVKRNGETASSDEELNDLVPNLTTLCELVESSSS